MRISKRPRIPSNSSADWEWQRWVLGTIRPALSTLDAPFRAMATRCAREGNVASWPYVLAYAGALVATDPQARKAVKKALHGSVPWTTELWRARAPYPVDAAHFAPAVSDDGPRQLYNAVRQWRRLGMLRSPLRAKSRSKAKGRARW
jgi:hypothetical protein